MSSVIVKRSAASYIEATKTLTEAIERRGLRVFARIDHAAAAHAVGLDMAEEEVVLFGDPRSGTPLMQSDPRVGIELPLRILVWREGEEVLLGYRDPRELASSYDVGQHASTLDRMATLLDALVTETANG
jgi:uncharacterized protein (DUF302 family)